jgi:hypothetical protein
LWWIDRQWVDLSPLQNLRCVLFFSLVSYTRAYFIARVLTIERFSLPRGPKIALIVQSWEVFTNRGFTVYIHTRTKKKRSCSIIYNPVNQWKISLWLHLTKLKFIYFHFESFVNIERARQMKFFHRSWYTFNVRNIFKINIFLKFIC